MDYGDNVEDGDNTDSDESEEIVESASEGEEEGSSEDSDSDSGSEIEIEIVDRAAQTDINMKDKNGALFTATTASEVEHAGSQTDLELDVSNEELSKDHIDAINRSLQKCFIENMWSFDMVESESFINLIKALDQRYSLPKRKKFVTDIGMLYNSVKDGLKRDIGECECVVFTKTLWKDYEDIWHVYVRAYFITNSWELQTAVLRTASVDKVAVNIAECMEETRQKWGVHEVMLVSDDSDLDRKVKNVLNWSTVPCFGSCIRHLASCAINDKDVKQLLQQGERLIDRVQTDETLLEIYQKKKEELLSSDGCERMLELWADDSWTSLLETLSVLVQLAPALKAALLDLINQGRDLVDPLQAVNDQASLETLVKILSAFKSAAEILTLTGIPTIQNVIPIFVKLEKELDVMKTDSHMIKALKGYLKQTVERQLQSCRDMCLLASLLHPQTKQMAFVSLQEKEHVKKQLLNKVKSLCEAEYSEQQCKEETFKRSKKSGPLRQTKSMSEVAGDSRDVRRVVVNVGDREQEESESDDGEIVDSEDGDGDVDDGGAQRDSKGMDRNSGGRGRDRQGKRDVKAGVDDSDVPRISITVDNDWLDDVICVSDDQRSPEDAARVEVNLYMAEPASSRPALEWWRERAATYPHISLLARQTLAVPASTLTPTDVFKLDSDIKKQYFDVKPEHLDMMYFLKENMDLF